MKKVLTALILFTSLTTQAKFIESGYLYGLSERFDYMVNLSSDVYSEIEYQDHGGWVDIDKMVENLKKGTGTLSTTPTKLKKPDRMHQLITMTLQLNDPYYCYTLQEDPHDPIDPEKCESDLRKLIGDAITQADAVYVVEVYGDYYGDYRFFDIIFADYKTKETIRISLADFHEI